MLMLVKIKRGEVGHYDDYMKTGNLFVPSKLLTRKMYNILTSSLCDTTIRSFLLQKNPNNVLVPFQENECIVLF